MLPLVTAAHGLLLSGGLPTIASPYSFSFKCDRGRDNRQIESPMAAVLDCPLPPVRMFCWPSGPSSDDRTFGTGGKGHGTRNVLPDEHLSHKNHSFGVLICSRTFLSGGRSTADCELFPPMKGNNSDQSAVSYRLEGTSLSRPERNTRK